MFFSLVRIVILPPQARHKSTVGMISQIAVCCSRPCLARLNRDKLSVDRRVGGPQHESSVQVPKTKRPIACATFMYTWPSFCILESRQSHNDSLSAIQSALQDHSCMYVVYSEGGRKYNLTMSSCPVPKQRSVRDDPR